MKIRHPFLVRLAGFLLWAVILAWLRTLRYRIVLEDPNVTAPRAQRPERFLYCFWHETLVCPAYLFSWQQHHVLVSQHADGELITRAIEHLGFRTIRGSVTRGALRATREMLRKADRCDIAIMTDGPRGPRRQVKPGIVYLASRTGRPIVPFGVAFSRAWRVRSWDRTAVPKPFAVGVVVGLRPMYLPADLEPDQLEPFRAQVQRQMERATALAERLAARYA